MASRYRGVPSMACANCRTRRIKCDRQRPICGQCKRSERVCAGYRDPLTLAFLDQSQDTILKVQSRQSTTPSLRSSSRTKPRTFPGTGRPATFASSQYAVTGPSCPLIKATVYNSKSPRDSTNVDADNPTLSPQLSPHHEDQAICFFFRNFVHAGTAGKSMYWYLPFAYNKNSTGAPLSDSIAAIGLTGLSKITRDRRLAIAGAKKYDVALRSIRDILYSKEADTDETAVTVELLGLYEVTACDGSPNLRSWARHIQGAIALLEARGKKQFDTELGCHAFLQLYRQIGKLCLQTLQRVPPKIVELAELCRNKFTKEVEFVFTFSTILAEVAALRAAINEAFEKRPPHLLTPRSWISSALVLSEKLKSWYSTLPPHCLPRVYELDNPNNSGFHSANYHVYPDIWIASCLSFYRVVSLLVREIVLKQLATLNQFSSVGTLVLAAEDTFTTLSHEDRSHVSASKIHMLQMTDDICASVPYMLNYHHSQESSLGDPIALSAYGGHVILCPLYISASMPFCPPKTWTYITERLQLIGFELGVGQALTLVHFLHKLRGEEWGWRRMMKDDLIEG